MAHGPRFSPYVSRFIGRCLWEHHAESAFFLHLPKGRATALGIGAELLVFCLDAEAKSSLRAAYTGGVTGGFVTTLASACHLVGRL